MAMVKVTNIHCTIGNKQILRAVNAAFEPARMNIILGPNGSGKSTLLRIISGDLQQYQGEVMINQQQLHSQSKAMLANYRAVMSQEPHLQFPLSVEEVILMGRYPFFQSTPGKHDLAICSSVIDLLQLNNFRKRNYLTLSGGEKQRVQYARVLAQIWQQPSEGFRYLLLDEPLNSLDIRYQQEFLKVAASLLNEKTVVIAVLHDLNLALRYGHHFICLHEGRVVADGNTSIVTPELLQTVFGVQARIIREPGYPAPYVVIS